MYSSKTKKKSNIEEVIKVIYKEKISDVGEKKKIQYVKCAKGQHW